MSHHSDFTLRLRGGRHLAVPAIRLQLVCGLVVARVHLVLNAVLKRELAALDLLSRCGEVSLREAHRLEELDRCEKCETFSKEDRGQNSIAYNPSTRGPSASNPIPIPIP